MYCTKCGKEIPDKAAFCPYCGAPRKKPQKDNKWVWIAILSLITVLAVIFGVLLIRYYAKGSRPSGSISSGADGMPDSGASSEEALHTGRKEHPQPAPKEYSENPEETDGRIDADQYFENRADIIAKIPAKESEDVDSESEVTQVMNDKGLSGEPVYYAYSIDGEFLGDLQAMGSAEETHPVYETSYVTEDGRVWSISFINGTMIALPVFYNVLEDTQVPVVLSETDYVMTYDSAENTFYQLIPTESTLTVIVVPRIDAETLEAYTIEMIEAW